MCVCVCVFVEESGVTWHHKHMYNTFSEKKC